MNYFKVGLILTVRTEQSLLKIGDNLDSFLNGITICSKDLSAKILKARTIKITKLETPSKKKKKEDFRIMKRLEEAGIHMLNPKNEKRWGCAQGRWGVILETNILEDDRIIVRIACCCNKEKSPMLFELKEEILKARRGEENRLNFDYMQSTGCFRMDGWVVWKSRKPKVGNIVKIQ